MKRKYYFYVLKNPDTNEIRYFGRTVNVTKRLKDHIRESFNNCNTHKCNWIRSLNNDPVIQVVYIEYCTIGESILIEKSILRKLMRRFNLTNSWDNCVGAFKTGKLVHQYSLNGDFIRTFQNANHASTVTGICDANILRCCKKSNNNGCNRAGKYLWLFEKYDKYPYLTIKNKRGNFKPVLQFDSFDNFIAEYESAREAERITGIGYKLISSVCTGNKKRTHGYKFKFKTKENISDGRLSR